MQRLAEIVLGICFVSVIPIILLKIREKESYGWNLLKEKGYYLYELTILNAVIFFLFYQNTEIILGTIIGSSLFRLLIIGGVQKLLVSKGKRLMKGQYLVFCMILVLFLAADYLFAGKTVVNCINQIDGLLLVFIFLLYLYMVYGKRWMGEYRKKRPGQVEGHVNDISQEDINILKKYDIKSVILKYICLELSILAGMYLLTKDIPILGGMYGISQYQLGITVVSWCVNLGDIYISLFDQKTECFLENTMEEIIICITLLLGIAALIHPILISQLTIYDLIIFSIIALLMQFIEKISNRFGGSAMVTVYLGFVLFVCVR